MCDEDSDFSDDWFDKDIDSVLNELKDTINGTNSDTEYISGEENDETDSATILAKLEQISEIREPMEVFLCVMSCEKFFKIQFKARDEKKAQLFTKVLAMVCRLQIPGFFEDILQYFVKNVSFHTTLRAFVTKIFSSKHENLNYDQRLIDDFISNIDFLFLVSCEQGLNAAIIELFEYIRNCILKNDNTLQCNRPTCIAFRNNLQQHLKNTQINQLVQSESEILPTLDEIKNITFPREPAKIELTEGAHSTLSSYLNSQKDSLRQGFIVALLKSIDELKNNKNTAILFKGVKICHKEDSMDKTPIFVIDLLGKKRNTNNEEQRTLMDKIEKNDFKYGTLLLLTTDLNFNNLILATVGQTIHQMERDYYINIEIVKLYNLTQIYEIDLIMFESPIYFEPFNAAYNALNLFKVSPFAMTNYIIHSEKSIDPPKYLNEETNYILMGEVFKPLIKSTTPNILRERLNDVQVNAYMNALSNEFCLIQGPPGTGKTHLSVNIMSTLVANHNEPIILITYTNDSLDKFLLELESETEDIVRFGNQSKNSVLNRFNIKEMGQTVSQDILKLKKLYQNTKKIYAMKFSYLDRLYKENNASYQTILAAQNDLRTESNKLQSIKIMFYYYKVKTKGVIAMTSTTASKLNLLFRLLQSSIVIFEEAAEILESHVVACLTPFTQHVILVGDHKQLQPPHSSLYPRYNQLNISLFERLVNEGLDINFLNKQYRMRKEIADLIRPAIYENLEDAEFVATFESVRGMRRNVYFFTHNREESGSPEDTSKYNLFEVDCVCQLANYLITKQNYAESDVVILSPYVNQVNRVSSMINEMEMFKAIRNLRVSTVDSFQGMEVKIVILSLVRNNKSNQIGFLAKTNRVCVSLSRAKFGLYLIGNIKLLAKSNQLWRKIKNILEAQNATGDSFPLENHV